MVEFKRKKGESFESFLRRFNKRLQQSGKLMTARKKRYFHKDKNENKKKTLAITRHHTTCCLQLQIPIGVSCLHCFYSE